MNEHIAKQIIDLLLLQHQFDDKLSNLGISITGDGEIGQLFLSLEDKTYDLLSEYMSLTDERSYDLIADIFQDETESAKIYHSLKNLQESQSQPTPLPPPPYTPRGYIPHTS